MNIVILDSYYERRDLAQMDMYNALDEVYNIRVAYNGEDVINLMYWADVLYLGIYHQAMRVNLQELFIIVRCPVIIDQADNEDFVRNFAAMGYDAIKTPKVFLSRYLPHPELTEVCAPAPVAQLSWYIDPSRFAPAPVKDVDVAFVCRLKGIRLHWATAIQEICKRRGWNGVIGETYGDDYKNIISRAKVFVVECGRKCYTQKYTEATLSGCTIVGDTPTRPTTTIAVIDADLSNLEKS